MKTARSHIGLSKRRFCKKSPPKRSKRGFLRKRSKKNAKDPPKI